MKLRVQATLPPGVYTAKFLGVEETPPNDEYGPGLRWKFEVLAGPQAGRQASRITGVNPTQKNAAGKLLASLIGQPLADGAEVDLAKYIGQRCTVVVGLAASGSTRVESVVRGELPQTGELVPF